MARHLCWLKARLTWNGLKADRQRRIGLPVVLGFMIWIAVRLASTYVAEFSALSSDLAGNLMMWAGLLFWLVWTALPVVIFPLDESLDPARFATLPIDGRSLITGLGLASLISPAAVLPVVLVGTNVALQEPIVWPVAIVAGVAFIALLAVSGQLFTSLVSSILHSRRSRDLAVFIVIALGLGSFAGYQVISRTIDELGVQGALASHPLDALWFLPPVALQRAVVETGEGNVVAGFALLAVGVAWVLGLAWLWHRLLARMLVTPDTSPRPARDRHARGFTEGLWGPRSVLARKELRFYVRDPRLRLVWTGTVIFVGLAIAGLVVGSDAFSGFREAVWLPLLAPALVLFVGLPIALNQFGWERNAASYLFVLPASPRQLLVGKNLATTSGLLLETVFVSLLLASLSGSWSMLTMVPGLTLAAIGCQLAVGNLVSVVAPLRLPREGTDVFAQTTEQGCLALVAQMGGFFAIGLLMVIPASAVVLTVSFGQVLTPLFTTTLSALWGLAAYLASLSFSGFLLRRRVPELVGWVQVV